jgi:phage shock protein A
MSLLDRVSRLIRANLNDLVDKAEDPEKLLKQLLLDMQNQFMQLKTQVAIAVADQHLLRKKRADSVEAQQGWIRKAELAVEKGEEPLARVALEHSLTHENAAANFAQQLEEQTSQVQHLRDTLHRLEQKMTETRTKADVLIAQHRRARLAQQMGEKGLRGPVEGPVLERMGAAISGAEAQARGFLALEDGSAERRLAELEKADQVDRLLAELKAKVNGAE